MCRSFKRFQTEDFKVTTWHIGGSSQDIQGTINWKMPTQHKCQEKNALLLHIVKFSKMLMEFTCAHIQCTEHNLYSSLGVLSVTSLMLIWETSKLIRISSFPLYNLLVNKQNLKTDNYLLIPDSVMSTWNIKSCLYLYQFYSLPEHHHIYWLQWRIYIRYSLIIW